MHVVSNPTDIYQYILTIHKPISYQNLVTGAVTRCLLSIKYTVCTVQYYNAIIYIL